MGLVKSTPDIRLLFLEFAMVAIRKEIGFYDVDLKALLQCLKVLLTNILVLKYGIYFESC